jgi:hypothetical protein
MFPRTLGERYCQRVENIGFKSDICLDVPVDPVIEEDWDFITLAGDILKIGILH